ncbi:DUF1800 domain-containing protein [Paraburkholderia sp. ZP32-5]|uniref:DUF1800 domain-containing protein n=1 Tax=Paraburkholderia sp. ZP32-5 TaxID=2883245 RepID=UPI001F350E3B|nr:DUF1800 domain-containing protein [Paraburkholderia sp. ZP32-5]
MIKLPRRVTGGPWFTVSATALAAVLQHATSAFAQQREPRAGQAGHRAQGSGATASTATTAEAESAQSLLDLDDARFFLTRTGFAPNHTELVQYVGLTREQAVDKLLSTARTESVVPPPDWVSAPIPTRAERNTLVPGLRREQQLERSRRYELLRAWWVHEMLTTPSPLTERMTLFWHNHFTSGQDKVQFAQPIAQQNMLLRRHALGDFGAMLHAVAKDPAMLQYLDGASNRKGKPNENFAREVMELFTLGEGHYTQRDVAEAARAYTGWSLDPDTQTYVWRANQHDDGDKTVLGQTGPFDGDQVLDILLARPETATFVTTKLWREFVSDTPDPARIEPIAAQFRASRYDIKVVLRGLLSSDAFWDDENRGVLVKSPVEFVVGTVRAFAIAYDDTEPFAARIRALGENLFYPPTVRGWPGSATWINSSTLLERKQFVEQLFRATEAAKPARMNEPAHATKMAGDARPMPASPANWSPQHAMARTAQGGVRFDIAQWLALYNTSPAAKPGLSTELQLQHAVLPFTPVDAIATDSTASAYLEALLMDPAYQLK